jgi:hypothetical protein
VPLRALWLRLKRMGMRLWLRLVLVLRLGLRPGWDWS